MVSYTHQEGKSRMEWFFEKKMGYRQVVPNCFSRPHFQVFTLKCCFLTWCRVFKRLFFKIQNGHFLLFGAFDGGECLLVFWNAKKEEGLTFFLPVTRKFSLFWGPKSIIYFKYDFSFWQLFFEVKGRYWQIFLKYINF